MSAPRPPGRLVVVATPIGNLGDLPPRALEVLRRASRICCEDTRRTRALLSATGVPAGGRLISLHAHNEGARLGQVLGWLAAGEEVALVTDAGTPAVSDPGARLVGAAVEAGHAVTTVPGPSAVLAALVVSGLPMERFCFEGFLPRRGAARRRRLEELGAEQRTAVVLEAPSRLAATLAELAALFPARRVAVARELTKVHEEVWRGTVEEAAAAFAERPARGEVVVVLDGAPPPAPAPATAERELIAALRRRFEAGDAPSRAAAAAAAELGVPRRHAYERALEIRRGPKGPEQC